MNVFNLAGHLNKCITNADGSVDQAGIDKLEGVWHGKLRGDTNILLRAIRNGAAKKAILGIGASGADLAAGGAAATAAVIATSSSPAAPAAAAWAATAAVIIAAMTPILTSILKSKNSFDSLTASQLAMQPTTAVTTSNKIQQYLPFILLAGVAYYVTTKKK